MTAFHAFCNSLAALMEATQKDDKDGMVQGTTLVVREVARLYRVEEMYDMLRDRTLN